MNPSPRPPTERGLRLLRRIEGWNGPYVQPRRRGIASTVKGLVARGLVGTLDRDEWDRIVYLTKEGRECLTNHPHKA